MGRLGDAMFRQLRAVLADDPESAGNAVEIAKAFEAYDRLVKDIRRGASSEEIARNELFQKRSNDRGTRIA